MYSDIFFAEKTKISATHTAETVLMAVSFKSKLLENNLSLSFIVNSLKLESR